MLFEVKDLLVLRQVCRSFGRLFDARYIHYAIQLGNLGHSLRCAFWVYKAPFEQYLHASPLV